MFEPLKEIALKYGYNLVLHGSLNRDMDLIAIPWVEKPKNEIEMIQALDMYLRGKKYSKANYLHSILPGGRNSYVINLYRGEFSDPHHDPQYYIDISVTPYTSKETIEQSNTKTIEPCL